MAGCQGPAAPLPELLQQLEALAAAAAPYFFLLAATKADELAAMLRLRVADCACGPEDCPQAHPSREAAPRTTQLTCCDGAASVTQAAAGIQVSCQATSAQRPSHAAAATGLSSLEATHADAATADKSGRAAAAPRWAAPRLPFR